MLLSLIRMKFLNTFHYVTLLEQHAKIKPYFTI
nr:MAG TPA: hypothetical protein [Caudoviricetes sp.]